MVCQLKGIDRTELEANKAAYRGLLQNIGQSKRRISPNFWVGKWKNNVKSSGRPYTVATDIRYQNEVDAIRELGGVVIMVLTPFKIRMERYAAKYCKAPSGHELEHPSETANYDYDLAISGVLTDSETFIWMRSQFEEVV